MILSADSRHLGLPSTYDGGELNATLTFSGESLASLGVNSDSDPYVYTLDGTGDTLTVTFGQTAVIPLPAGLPLLAGGLGLLALLRRR